jgi:hypothetical protein
MKKVITCKGCLRLFVCLPLLSWPTRDVPAAALVVTTTNDGGAGSLRQAIASAGPGDTINFSIFGLITLTNGELMVTNDLTVAGPGATNLAISGNTSSRIFQIARNVTMVISDLAVTAGATYGRAGTNASSSSGSDGEPGIGGGILNLGVLTLKNCMISSNLAVGGPGGLGGPGFPNGSAGDAAGGGIFNGGRITISNCVLRDNRVCGGDAPDIVNAIGSPAGTGHGGALCSTNVLSLRCSTFWSNHATGGNGYSQVPFFGPGAGGAGGHGEGGAIYSRGVASVICNSFLYNVATGGRGGSGGMGTGHSTGGSTGGSGGAGGSGHGGAIDSEGIVAEMTNNTCAANRAAGGQGGSGGEGGGTGCFTGSQPGAGGDGGVGGDGVGGAISHTGGPAFVLSLTCSGNYATEGAGGPGGLGGTTPGSSCSPAKPARGRSGLSGTLGQAGAGGMHVEGATFIQNTIIAANNPANSADVTGAFTSRGFNLIGATNNSSGWLANDRTGNLASRLDPYLGPLTDNGGSALTMALLANSPAIDAGNATGLAIDQRGRARPFDHPTIPNSSGGDGSDIGAFELQSGAPVFVDSRKDGADIRLRFQTEVGHRYLVERKDHLSAAPWITVTNNVPGSGGVVEIIDPGGAAHDRRFYRGVTSP